MAKLIGTAPNQVPTNGDLGSMAFEDKQNYVTRYNPIYQPYRNLIINGDMSIAQRGTSVSFSTGGYKALDRYTHTISASGTFTVTQDTDVPSGQGFGKSLKMACIASTSLSAGAYNTIEITNEGQLLQHLKKGTSNAESVTMSFWVKSNKTGTYVLELRDRDNNRHISKTYTINSADTWEKKELTYEGDTVSGFDNDNNNSLSIFFWLGGGTTYTSGSTPTSWSSQTSANMGAGLTVNLADSTSNYINFTGVQLEVGTSASNFEFLPYDVNLQRCYRYFYNWISEHNYQNICVGSAISTLNARGIFQLPIKMRTAPSVSANGNFRIVDMGTDVQKTGTGSMVSIARSSSHIVYMNFATNGSLTKGNNCEMGANNDVDAEILFDAEL